VLTSAVEDLADALNEASGAGQHDELITTLQTALPSPPGTVAP
jgi:hypothetical protein